MARKHTFNPHPYAYGEQIELEITSLTNLGVGLGRHHGWVVMVPFTIPGETVRIRVWRNHANYSEADLLEVLQPSPDRVEPSCPLFTVCSGCQYQHFAYESQLAWKQRHVQELLQRIGGLSVTVSPTRPSPRAYGYRAKLTPHYRWPRGGQKVVLGFLRQDRRGILDLPECPIATDPINKVLREQGEALRERFRERKRDGTMLLRDTGEDVVTDMRKPVEQNVDGLRFGYIAGEFFQNNPFLLPEMVRHVLTEAQGDSLAHLVDVYCGVGLFALHGASRFQEVLGIEVNEVAVAAARENQTRNAITNCRFLAGSAEAIFAEVPYPAEETAVILDPPRRGCDPSFLQQLGELGPARVVYVSCDPATQARDAAQMVRQGFDPILVQPFDLFPQTRHIESVITFVRRTESADITNKPDEPT